MKNNQGFTLLEMMVVVALIAILATLAAPSMRTMIQRSQVSEQMNQLSAFLQEARGKAVIRRVPYQATIATGVAGGSSAEINNSSGSWAPDSDKVALTAGSSTTPTTLTFSLMGTIGADVCYIITHTNNPAIGQVLVMDKNGAAVVHKHMTTCP